MAEPTKRSGNGWGGARPGAGRKPSPMSGYAPASNPQRVRTRDPLKFLLLVMQGKFKPTRSQMRAARVAVAYLYAKCGGRAAPRG